MSLNIFPDELIHQILEYLPPEDTLRYLQPVSRRLFRLANEPILWRHYCRTSFRYWSPEHRFHEKLQAKDPSVNWKAIFIYRKSKNRRISVLLDHVISTKVRRHQRVEQLSLFGYDAKDFLLQQCRVEESTEDYLARRYFSNAILGSIHRSIALKEWGETATYDERPSPSELAMGYRKKRLERLLGAFDMFFIQEDEGDIDWISRELDILARIFLQQNPGFENKSIREKALILNSWLRMYDYTGMNDPANYRRLTNCLIGHALLDREHNSLPVISTAIFVAMAHRLDIPASPCAFPSHVHALVSRTEMEGLNGPTTVATDNDVDLMMYLDPYGSTREVSKQELRMRLVERGWDGSGAVPYLRPTADHDIVLRVAQNIRASCSSAISWTTNHYGDKNFVNPFFQMLYGRNTLPRSTATVRDTAMYCTLWSALLMVQPEEREDWPDLLMGILSMVASDWVEDVWLVQKYLAPLFDRHRTRFPNHRINPKFPDVWSWCLHVMTVDRSPVTVTRRDDLTWSRVKYRIGHVVRHKRYDFIGIIISWNYSSTPNVNGGLIGCESGHGRFETRHTYHDHPYYSCLSDDAPGFVAREQSLEPVYDPQLVPDSLLRAAGRYFKRFDRYSCTFISNIREMYPDD